MVWIAQARRLTAASLHAIMGRPRRHLNRRGLDRRIPAGNHAAHGCLDRLLKSKRDGQLLIPILALCGDQNGESLLDLPLEGTRELVPACVIAITAYWREKGPKQISMAPLGGPPLQPHDASSKIGRNDPCPCGKRCL
jgi:hypothetical protein